MLQLPETATAEFSAVLASAPAEIFPPDVRSLIALHREADAAVDASLTDDEMEPHNFRAHNIYRALISATPSTLQEEAERLTYILAYLKKFGAASDTAMDGGWLDLPQLQHIAKNLTKLSEPVGPGALKIISKSIQPMSRSPEPNLAAQLDSLEKDNDLYGMIALYDYFVLLAKTSTAFSNAPRAGTLDDFLTADNERFWAKAYAVADRLKKLKPTKTQREYHARALIDAAFAMGGNLKDVAAVVQHLSEAHT